MIDGTKELLTALNSLSELMTSNDGSGVEGSLKGFLKEFDVPNTHLVARTLTEKGIITMTGSKRKPIYFWNINKKPNAEMCEDILMSSREKRHGNLQSKKTDNNLLNHLYFASQMGFREVEIEKLIKYMENNENS